MLLCVGMAWLCTACGNGRQSGHMVTKEKVTHPCLLLKAGEESKIKANLKKSEELRIVEDVWKIEKTSSTLYRQQYQHITSEGGRMEEKCEKQMSL